MRSMTGYGRGSAKLDGREITVEIKSVNHRFLDLSFRLPRALNFAEPMLRDILSSSLARGHVDVSLGYQNHRQDAKLVEADTGLALSYIKAAEEIARAGGLSGGLPAGDLLSLPDVVRIAEAQEDEETLKAMLIQAAEQAVSEMIDAREREGAALAGDLRGYLGSLDGMLRLMKALAPEQPENYRRKLSERIARLMPEGIEPQRLAQEVALFADRVSVDEELARLDAHIGQMGELLAAREPMGRKMDFLVQEMNREVNTIGSKTSELQMTRLVLNAKNALEKMREQIQNAE